MHPSRSFATPSRGAALRVERVTQLPDGFAELAADAQGDGQRMLEVLRQDWDAAALQRLRFDQPGEALLAAHLGGALVGLCGLTRDPYLRGVAAGRVRRLYVRRASRGIGAGAGLVAAVAAEAAAFGYARLRVRSPPSAFRFYEGCGFLRLVGQTAATHARPLSREWPAGTP